MLYTGVSATGTVDFKTTLVTGKIETGSAGLLAMLFGFIIIYSANSNGTNENNLANRFVAVVRMLINCKYIISILGVLIIILLLPLVYLLEPMRIYLIILIGAIFLSILLKEK